MDRAGRRQRQRLAEVPEQLVELPHDGKHSEHLPGQAWLPPPVPPAEGHLGDLLPRAEAVIDRAAREPLRPEAIVNGAAEVPPQVGACLPGALVDGEIGRGREGRRDTAQPEAAPAVRAQPRTVPAGDGSRGWEWFGQGGASC